MVELFANSGDPDQTLHSVASDLNLHCLPITLSEMHITLAVMESLVQFPLGPAIVPPWRLIMTYFLRSLSPFL